MLFLIINNFFSLVIMPRIRKKAGKITHVCYDCMTISKFHFSLDLQYFTQFGQLNVFKFKVVANMESNDVHYPPFACPLRCFDASKPVDVQEPFLVYHFLKSYESMYRAVHPDNKSRASGILVINWQDSLKLDSTARLFKDQKEARKVRLPVILVGYHYFLDYDFTVKKPNFKVVLSLKEASELIISNCFFCSICVHPS